MEMENGKPQSEMICKEKAVISFFSLSLEEITMVVSFIHRYLFMIERTNELMNE